MALGKYGAALLLLSGTTCILVGKPSTWGLDFTYHSNDDIDNFFKETATFYPDFAEIYSIGRSVQGRELHVLKLTALSSAVLGTPHVKLVANIHGNEPVGKEILLHLIQYLLRRYPEDEEVQSILNSTVIHFMPNMNPDGNKVARERDCGNGPGRRNSNGVDLNRNFPDVHRTAESKREPETQAIINWMNQYKFVLSASMHGGAMVVNYPLDNTSNGPITLGEVLELLDERNVTDQQFIMDAVHNNTETGTAEEGSAASEDDDIFEELAHTYADNHATMHRGGNCKNGPAFPGGITRGAEWYSLTGGMQDYNYFEHGCMELTLEISCCKYPPAADLPQLWNENRKALLEFIKKANDGIRGQVLNAVNGHVVPNVTITVNNRSSTFSTSEKGEFWRILVADNYLLRVQAPGFLPQIHPVVVRRRHSSEPASVWLSVYLQPVEKEELLFNGGGNLTNQNHFTYLIILVIILINVR